MKDKNISSFNEIIKSTSIFGGLQIFNILISILRSKMIAVFLGPSGIGIYGLITSSLGLVSGITNFGLATVAVKSITEANATSDKKDLNKALFIIKKTSWITGFFGLLLTFFFAKKMSIIAFQNEDYIVWFRFLSIVILTNQLNITYNSLFQGLRKFSTLTKITFLSSLISFLISIPLFYFFQKTTILLSIIITSFVSLSISIFFAKDFNFHSIKLNTNEILIESYKIIKVGFLISLSFLLGTVSSYLLQIYITNKGGVEQVGLYLAGFAIINNYVGIIFSAMSTEYYPRLTLTASNFLLSKKIINQQAEFTLLVLAPILLFFIIFINFIINLLYSNSFLLLNDMLYWSAIGVYFKCIGWPIAYYFLARGDGKLYFINELISVFYSLALSILGYYLYGMTGLGVAYMVSQILYLFQCYIITRFNFKFEFDYNVLKIFTIQLLIAFLTMCLIYFRKHDQVFYFSAIVLLFFSFLYSFYELEKRIQILDNLKHKFFRK
jgi:O-antigen/teichoic acid export membrane protein